MSHPDNDSYDDIPDFEDGALDIPEEDTISVVRAIMDSHKEGYKLGFAEGKVAGMEQALKIFKEGT